MASINDYDRHVGIHYRNLAEVDPARYGNPHVANALAKVGIGTLLVPSKEAYDFADGSVRVHETQTHLSDGEPILTVAPRTTEVALGGDRGGIEAVRARVLTPRALEAAIPVLNGPALREIGNSKAKQYEIAKDYMPRSVLLDENMIDESILDQLRGDKIVVKGDSSRDSQYMQIAARSEALITAMAMRAEMEDKERLTGKTRKNKNILLQEYVPGMPWSGLRGTTAEYDQILRHATNMELRMYCYVDANNEVPPDLRYFGTARVFENGEDRWVPVTQESIPSQVFAASATISSRVLQEAGVSAGYIVEDFFQGAAPDEREPHLFLREINTKDAMMVDVDEDLETARAQRGRLAAVLAVASRQPRYNKERL